MLCGCLFCLLAVLLVSIFPAAFGTAPYCTVEGPIIHIGSQLESPLMMALWFNALLLLFAFRITPPLLRSSDVHAITCTLNC
jgi:hypothetical protein